MAILTPMSLLVQAARRFLSARTVHVAERVAHEIRIARFKRSGDRSGLSFLAAEIVGGIDRICSGDYCISASS
jgi:hypothetical protein